MALRSPIRTLADLRELVARLERNRNDYDLVSFAQLKRILHRRISALAAEVRGKTSKQPPASRAA